jgi:hypothetical protein
MINAIPVHTDRPKVRLACQGTRERAINARKLRKREVIWMTSTAWLGANP